MGMLSYHAISDLQDGHRDRGATTDWPAGRREMQTLRKLPIIRPNRPMINNGKTVTARSSCAAAAREEMQARALFVQHVDRTDTAHPPDRRARRWPAHLDSMP